MNPRRRRHLRLRRQARRQKELRRQQGYVVCTGERIDLGNGFYFYPTKVVHT